MKWIAACIGWVTVIGMVACQPTQKDAKEHKESERQKGLESASRLKQTFLLWKAKQDPQLITAYHGYVASYLRYPPSEFELMTNQNQMPKECEWTRFAIPPKKYWHNIIQSLQLIEKLKLSDYFEHYQLSSSFRNPEMNVCVRGAGKSKHLHNYAVDFQVLDADLKQPQQRKKLQQALCEFWKKEGQGYRMGLGVYHDNRFHIDVQGYRTWGNDYSRKTSPCLKH